MAIIILRKKNFKKNKILTASRVSPENWFYHFAEKCGDDKI